MPVTPQFRLEQDDAEVLLHARVPYVRVSGLDYSVDGASVSLFVKPYLLKLVLPGEVLDDERTKAVYDPNTDNGTVTLHLPKKEHGTHFPDLDLLTKLQAPKRRAGPGSGPGQQHLQHAELVDLRKESAALETLISGSDDDSAHAQEPDPPSAKPDPTAPLIQVLSSMTFDEDDNGGPKSKSNDKKNHENEDQAGAATAATAKEGTSDEGARGEGASGEGASGKGASGDAMSAIEKEQLRATEKRQAEEDILSKMLAGTTLADAKEAPAPAPSPALAPASAVVVQLVAPRYGFNRSLEGFFADLRQDFPDLVDLPDPDHTAPEQRWKLRSAAELEAFDVDRYVGDLGLGDSNRRKGQGEGEGEGEGERERERGKGAGEEEEEEEDAVFKAAMTYEVSWLATDDEAEGSHAQGADVLDKAAEGKDQGEAGAEGTAGEAGGKDEASGGEANAEAGANESESEEESSDSDSESSEGESSAGDSASDASSESSGDSESDGAAAPKEKRESVVWDEGEREQMLQLHNKEFLAFSTEETERALCAILDVVLAFLLDSRMTQGEGNVESAWTIRKVSATLSWLEELDDPGHVVCASVSRMMLFPYVRHMQLAQRVLEDAQRVVTRGRRGLLRCLLAAHAIFARSEVLYLHNRLYVGDMCVWIQQAPDAHVAEFLARAGACLGHFAADPYLAVPQWDLRRIEQEVKVETASQDET